MRDPCLASRTTGPRIITAYIMKMIMSPASKVPASTACIPIHRAARTAPPNTTWLHQVAVPCRRVIDASWLPDGETKFRIFLDAHDRFRAAGYRYIGMDHFALPDDELSSSFDDGTLRRNFMGFTTKAGSDLISMGVSSISSVTNLFSQNTKKLTRYAEAVEAGRFPVERGFILDRDAIAFAFLILVLMIRPQGLLGRANG